MLSHRTVLLACFLSGGHGLKLGPLDGVQHDHINLLQHEHIKSVLQLAQSQSQLQGSKASAGVKAPAAASPPADSAAGVKRKGTLGPGAAAEAPTKEFPARWTKGFSLSELTTSQAEADKVATRVKDAMKFCWEGYKVGGIGADDVQPLSGKPSNWAHLGVAVLESLDTMHLMGLNKEFDEADAWVRDNLKVPNQPNNVQTMEITIRALGGLLSAYSLTRKPEFLEKANILGRKILKSAYNFDSDHEDAKQTLLPLAEVDLFSKRIFDNPQQIYTAEAGTLQLEFAELSALTGDPVFQRVTGKSVDAMLDAMERDGVAIPLDTVLAWKNQVNFIGYHTTLGARVDSFLEYLVKAAVQDSSKVRLRKSFRKIMDAVFDKLVFTTKKNTTFLAELDNGKPHHNMDHLVCFMPGVLMLASRNFPKEEVDARWEPLAAALTETCHKMYTFTESHLAPEFTEFDMKAEGDMPDMRVPPEAPWNLLRPEAAEALFLHALLHRQSEVPDLGS